MAGPDPMDAIRKTFFLECEDLLEALLEGLDALSAGTGDTDTVHSVFRAVHSIKGGAGAFGLDRLVTFAHRFESGLDALRTGRIEADAGALQLFLRAADLLGDLVRASRDGLPTDAGAEDSVLADLDGLLGTLPEEREEDLDFAPALLAIPLDDDDAEDAPAPLRLSFRPHEELYLSGNDPRHILAALSRLGPTEVTCHTEALPDLATLNPESSYLHWTVRCAPGVTAADIEAAFEFVAGLCDLEVTPDAHPVPAAVSVPADLPPPDKTPRGAGPAAPPPAPSSAAAPVATTQTPTVRVDLDRVDRLVNLVGELVINQAMLSQSVRQGGLPPNSPVMAGLDEFLQLTRDIQDSVMMIRAQPIKPLFQRMGRIVREAASRTGKAVRLETSGEGTEIDKTVLDKLTDPLTHMIRNAVDHGLESAEVRRAAGKPDEGTVHLAAHHRSGRVIIDVSDDGGGLDRARIRARAIERGLLAEEADPTPSDLDALLFQPGFSTVDTVSDLSGRGVGMDVVKRAIQTLGGRIAITTEPGQGTTFSISLPLTLAILDGMVVEAGGETMVMPLGAVLETQTVTGADMDALTPESRVLRVRGRMLPLLDLGEVLGHHPRRDDLAGCVALIVQAEGGSRYALTVDRIADQRQVVIKGLGDSYGPIPGIAAATILGDGQVALILDPIELREHAPGVRRPLAETMP
jgi:two-component system chemotaxis sensor kinase CheA